jgi:hypothetical protein
LLVHAIEDGLELGAILAEVANVETASKGQCTIGESCMPIRRIEQVASANGWDDLELVSTS